MAAAPKTTRQRAATSAKLQAGPGEAPADLPLTPARVRENPALPPFRMVAIDKLVPYENNARVHSPAQHFRG